LCNFPLSHTGAVYAETGTDFAVFAAEETDQEASSANCRPEGKDRSHGVSVASSSSSSSSAHNLRETGFATETTIEN
jgi:hypothetical protein